MESKQQVHIHAWNFLQQQLCLEYGQTEEEGNAYSERQQKVQQDCSKETLKESQVQSILEEKVEKNLKIELVDDD